MKDHSSRPHAQRRSEWQVLLELARAELEPGRVECVRNVLRDGLDWAWLIRLAEAWGTIPLLSWHLQRIAADITPPDIRDSLGRWVHDNACRNLLLTGELLRLLDLFAAHEMRVIPFKGPTLAAFAYGNLALRQFVDLDLLLAPADLPRARRLLLEQGYCSGLPLPPSKEGPYLASIGQMPFVKNGRACMVELHARIAPRDFYFPLDLNRLWPRLRPLVLAGKEVAALAGEDLLLILCAHGAKHGWRSLGWICDVAELLRVHRSMDWPAVVEEAQSLRCERILLLGLLLAHDLLEAPVPEALLHRARAASAVRALMAHVTRQMFHGDDDRREGLRNALFQLRVREGFRDGLRYALSLALTPTVADWTALEVPPSLSFVHYLFRPIRLVGKYGMRLLGWRGLTSPHPRESP